MRFPLLSKAGALALVAVMVVGAVSRIDGLVEERRLRGVEARRSVQASFAGPQIVTGPVLARACVEDYEGTVQVDGHALAQTIRSRFTLAQPPTTLSVAGQVKAQPLHRGLYKVNAWQARFDATARFESFERLIPHGEHGGRVVCEPIRLMMSPSDVRGVRAAGLSADGRALQVQPGGPSEKLPRGFSAALPAGRGEAGDATPLAVHATLDLVGTTHLAWVPAAGSTEWKLASDWPHPSFGGDFLPAERSLRADGFDATWRLSALATRAPEQLTPGTMACGGTAAVAAPPADDGDGDGLPASCLDTMAVSFIDPVNPYVLSDRAVKYAVLFVALTFVAVALAEVMSGRRVHPVQYLLVGLALSLFFLLLLSLSEHLPFAGAYALAAAACTALLAFYASAMFARRLAGLAFGAGVAVLYGLLYTLLQMEQNALAIGSVMLFAALATVMGLTRRLDWYALFARMRQPDAAR